MRRNSYLGASGKKSDPAIRSGDVISYRRGITLLSYIFFSVIWRFV